MLSYPQNIPSEVTVENGELKLYLGEKVAKFFEIKVNMDLGKQC